MADMNVTFDDMRAAAKDLADGQSEIEGRLTSLQNGIKNLVNAGYVTGKSSVAFERAYDEFNTGVSKTIEGLNGMGEFLKSAATAMDDTDTQLANALNKG